MAITPDTNAEGDFPPMFSEESPLHGLLRQNVPLTCGSPTLSPRPGTRRVRAAPASERAVDGLGRVCVGAVEQVAVHVHGGLQVLVAEVLLNGQRVGVALD